MQNSLDVLMQRMTQSQPVFVRCIKPNSTKSAHSFDEKYVTAQVRICTMNLQLWLPQSTHLQNGYLALIRQCLELVRYMLPAALEYPPEDWDGFRVYRPARGGRSCEHFGGYKTINRIPLPLVYCKTGILYRHLIFAIFRLPMIAPK